MKTEDLIKMHSQLTNNALEIIQAKNADYCGDTDALANFKKTSERLNLHPGKGILLRIEDKIGRLNTFVEKGRFAISESFRDTVIDSINYLILLNAVMSEEGERNETND